MFNKNNDADVRQRVGKFDGGERDGDGDGDGDQDVDVDHGADVVDGVVVDQDDVDALLRVGRVVRRRRIDDGVPPVRRTRVSGQLRSPGDALDDDVDDGVVAPPVVAPPVVDPRGEQARPLFRSNLRSKCLCFVPVMW